MHAYVKAKHAFQEIFTYNNFIFDDDGLCLRANLCADYGE
jgi:hypothetical protein